MAADIVEDYDAGLEYCDAQCILKSVQRGDEREYLVRYDGLEKWVLLRVCLQCKGKVQQCAVHALPSMH